MQISVYIATSLDGFIATPDGSVDWLTAQGVPEDTEEFGYTQFISTVDVMVMGRKTLEIVLSFGGVWPYEGTKVIVLSSSMKEIPEDLQGKIELYNGSIIALTNRLRSENCARVYVDGGTTIQSFLREGLITDLTITRVPIILGEGIPLFASVGESPIKLKHIKTADMGSSFVASTYQVI